MNSKKWLIVSILCIAAGLILLLVSGVRNTGDLDSMMEHAGTEEALEEKTVTVTQDFDSIAVKEASTDVQLLPSGDGSCRVVYGENERVRYSVKVEGKTLTVSREDKGSVNFGITFYTREIPLQIYLPEQSYRSLLIESASGDVLPAPGFSWETAEISTASGDLKLQDFQADELQIRTASGEVNLDRVRAEKLRIESASGDQSLRDCKLGTLKLETASGEIDLEEISLAGEAELDSASGEITLKQVEAEALELNSHSGELRLERTSCAGMLRAETTSGEIRLKDAAAGSFELRSTSGDVEGNILGTVDFIVDTASGEVSTAGGVRGGAPCRVRTTSGDVDLKAEG